MADIIVDVSLPNPITTDVTSPTQALATNISVPGPQGPTGPKGNPTTINSLSAENIIITGANGNIVSNNGISTIYISGNSGYFQSAVNTLTTNLQNTGSNLYSLLTNFSGNLDATYASDLQLYNTGSTLDTKINSLSGYSASIVNLASTGSTLNSKINSLSGWSASDVNLSSTGSNLDIKINSLSGNLITNYATITNLDLTGSVLDSKINSLSGYSASIVNLQSTGSNLYSMLTGFSGNLDATYATDSQLYSTGSTLDTKINTLSGYVTGTNSTFTTNLFSTGSTLDTKINTLSGYVTGTNSTFTTNLFSTGSTLDTKINTLSGYVTGTNSTFTTNLFSTGSTLDTKINTLSGYVTGTNSTFTTNLFSTGSTLDTKINTLSGYVTGTNSTFTTNLFSTGSTLDTKINTLSGYVTGITVTLPTTIVYTTGDQTVSGIKTFASRPTVNGTGVLLSGEASAITLPTTIVYTTGAQTISGNKIFINNIYVSGTGYFQDINISNLNELVLSGARITISGNSGVYSSTNIYISGNPVLTGIDLTSYATTINLTSTGSTLDTKINNLSGYITGSDATLTTNLISTGSNLNNSIISLSGLFTGFTGALDATFATDLQLYTTGSTLDNKINSLSGVTVLTYSNQTINGLKDFTTRPTVNTTPVLLSGENANGLTVLVKNDESATLLKGQPVYIYGANGNNILVRKASNTGEAYSSKTLGLLAQDLTSNAQGFVITEGALEGINTNGGNAGDPIWLGPTGDLIFGLANKPYAPNHLVYLGVIERKQSNNGKVYVKVQNGFELQELHNVNIDHKNTLNDNDILRYNSASGLWFNETLNTGIFQTQINSLSGSSVLLYGDQSVGGVKTFRDNVYINNLFVTGAQTVVSTNNFSVQSPYLLLNLTGGAVDGGIFFVTGAGLTGANDSGPIIGFDHSNKFKFGVTTRNSDLSTLPDIASVQNITTYSGFVDGKYATIINLVSTGSTLSTNLASTGSTLQTNINNLSNTYATITNLVSTGSTLDTKINNLSGVSVLTFSNQTINGNKTFTNTGTFNSGLDLNNSNLINATPQIINLSANFNISGNYNSRMIMVNSATQVTGNIISGNSLGFNVSIIQIGAGQVFITGITNNIPVLSYSGLYRTAGIGAAISVLHTGNNGYIMYGNTV